MDRTPKKGEFSLTKLSMPADEVKALIGSEAKNAEMQFLAMASELAHEINNPNNFTSVSVQNAEFRLKELKTFLEGLLDDDVDQEIKKAFDFRFNAIFSQLSLAKEGCQRVAGIVRTVREKSKGELNLSTLFDPVEVLNSTLPLVKQGMTDALAIKTLVIESTALRPGGIVKGNPNRMAQLFTNLLVNASHAIEERGQREPHHQGKIQVFTQHPEREIGISIADNGAGMSPHTLQRLFEQRFTTKPSHKGTGLGMGVCKTIAEEHKGRIEVKSTEGQGTTITVWLPLNEMEE